MNPFGTHNDWSTWSGLEIGGRILHFLNSKMDCSSNDSTVCKIADSSGPPESMAEFYNYSEPPISLGDYIYRLMHYTRLSVSPVNLAVALLYIDRIERKGLCKVTKHSIFRLLSTAYLVAFKHTEDSKVMKNSEYCKIAGISVTELNQLELIFLMSINFELGVGPDIALSQRITRILVPPKVSPEIILNEKQYQPDGLHRWTPDSVIDLENKNDDEYDEDEDGVFDQISIVDNYPGLFNRANF
jgi:Cyclin